MYGQPITPTFPAHRSHDTFMDDKKPQPPIPPRGGAQDQSVDAKVGGLVGGLEGVEPAKRTREEHIDLVFAHEMLDIAAALEAVDFGSPDDFSEASEADLLEVNEISGIFDTGGVFSTSGAPQPGSPDPRRSREAQEAQASEDSGLIVLDSLSGLVPLADESESEPAMEIDPLRDDFEILQEVDIHQVQEQASAAFIAGHEREGFRILLESLGRRLALQEPWASWAAELRLDALEEADTPLRGSYLYLFAMVLKLHGEAGQVAAARLEGQLAQGGGGLRSFLLEQLAGSWSQSEMAFMDQFALLRAHDEAATVPQAQVRHLSIAAARLLGTLEEGGGGGGAGLLAWVSQSEGPLSLLIEALFAHKRSDHVAASGYWRRIADYLTDPMRQACLTLAGYLLHDRTHFFDQLRAAREHDAPPALPPELLISMQYVSCWQGEYTREAQVLQHLLAGPQAGPVSDQAAQWARLGLLEHAFATHQDDSPIAPPQAPLGTLLRQAFAKHREQQMQAEPPLTGVQALLRARQLDPSRLEYALLLGQVARRDQNMALIQEALEAQVELVQDPAMRALWREQLAWTWALEGGWDARARKMLEHGLEEAPESLPLLLTLGQVHVQKSDWGAVMKVRSKPDLAGGALTLAWRRANLLEHARGDAREILSLYRSASHRDPTNVHLYFGVERSLARLGLWRGMVHLFEQTWREQPEFAALLGAGGVDLEGCVCAVEMYLEDGPPPSIERLEAHLERHRQDFYEDAVLFYRVLAHRVRQGNLDGVLGELEVLIERASLRGEVVDGNRAMLWKAYVQGWHLKEEGGATHTLRQLFLDATVPAIARFTFHALLRFDDHLWLAEQLAGGGQGANLLAQALGVESGKEEGVRIGLAAELMAREDSGQLRAAQRLVAAPVAPLTGLWRALEWTAASHDWEAVARTILGTALVEERGLWELALYLDAASDRPGSVLGHMGGREVDEVALWMALESAMRHGTPQACITILRAFQEGGGRVTRGSSAALAFLGTSLEEWVERDDVRALLQARLWSERLTEGSTELDMLCMLGSWYRAAKRQGEPKEASEVAESIRALFDPAFVEIFDQESKLREGSLATCAGWYSRRIGALRQSLGQHVLMQPYLQLMGAWVGWLADPQSVEALDTMLDLWELEMETPALIQWAGIVASRQLNLQEETLRRLAQFLERREEPAFAAWGQVRAVMHLGVGMRRLEEGLVRVAQARVTRDRPVLCRLEEVLIWAMGEPDRLATVVQGSASLLPAHAEHLEWLRAQRVGDSSSLEALATRHHPAALLWAELLAACERRDWRADQNIELLYAALRTSRHGEPQESVRRRFVRVLEAGGESLIASPWCPLRLIQDDLAVLGASGPALDEIVSVAGGVKGQDASSHVRLVVAKELLRHGRTAQALGLMPKVFDTSLAGCAWSWLDQAHEEVSGQPQGLRLMRRIAFWRVRMERAAPPAVRCAMMHEVAQRLEQVGEQAQAQVFYEEILEQMPDFAPAEVALVRGLQERQQWENVVRVWSRSLERQKEPEQVAHLAYRIGFVHERWLGKAPGAQARALEAYAVVLGVDKAHLPALTGALRIALGLGAYDRAAELLKALIPVCVDRALRTAYWVQLGCLYEQELGDQQRALAAYQEAYGLDGTSDMAMLGILRTDRDQDHAVAARVLGERLEHAAQQELHQGGRYLFLLTEQSGAASVAMRRFQPQNVNWRLVQLAKGLEHGVLEQEAVSVVRQAAVHPQVKLVFTLLEQLHLGQGAPGGAGEVGQGLAEQIGRDALYEGVLLGMLAQGHARPHDLGRQEVLAQMLARRAFDLLDTASQWLKRVFLLRWSGRTARALEEVEKVHERFPHFLPAVKFGRLLTQEASQWAGFAQFAVKEAELTRVPRLAAKLRLEASEAQRQFVGDLGSAIAQLQLVLQGDPLHEEAFEKLRTLLVQAERFEDALGLIEQRLALTGSPPQRLKLLNTMADLALGPMQDAPRAIRYLGASIKLKPRQLRRLRILAELYESNGQYDQAIACYNAATRCAPEEELTAKMLLQMGVLSEHFLHNDRQADQIYQRLLGVNPEHFEALHARARLRKKHHDFQGALELMRQVERAARTPQEHKQARLSKLELVTLLGSDVDRALAQAHEVLLNHPDHVEAGDMVRELLTRAGRQQDLEGVVRQITLEALAHQPNPQMEGFFVLAKHLHLHDLAYCIAASLRWRGRASGDVTRYHEGANLTRRWPHSPVPAELTTGMLPRDLSVSIVEIMRRSSQGLTEACQPVPFGQFVRRKHRLGAPEGEMQALAWRWPELFGLNLREVYKVDKLPLGSAIVWDDGVRLLIDESWGTMAHAYPLLVRLGCQLAAWSMGIGYWALLGREAQISLFTRLVASVSVSWDHQPSSRLPRWLSMDRFDRWIGRDGADLVAGYALELASQRGAQVLPEQFTMLELAMERLACVVLPDPEQFLGLTVRLGVEHGPAQRPWAFMLSAEFAALRQAIGVAYEP